MQEIRATNKIVECFYEQKRIAVHERSHARYKFTTLMEHMPPAHKAHAEWSPERIQRWANKIGTHTHSFIAQMISSRAFPQQAFRSCLGLLRLASRYGEERLEKACAIAYQAGATRYQQVESILKNKMDLTTGHSTQSMSPTPIHNNIRGSNYYQ